VAAGHEVTGTTRTAERAGALMAGGARAGAAARAAVLAVSRGGPGIYNVVDDDGPVSNHKARAILGWPP
jgi:hypothetical protein